MKTTNRNIDKQENVKNSQLFSGRVIELHRQIANSELAIIPGGHGQYIGEVTTITPDFKESDLVVPMIEKFLDEKLKNNADRHERERTTNR